MVAPTPNPMTVEQWNADPANAGYRMYIGEDGNTYVEYVGQTADWQQAGPSPQQLATASTTGTPTDTYGGVVTQSSGTTPAMSEGPRTPEAKQALDSVANTSFSSSDTQGAEADPNLLTRYSFFDEIGNRIAGEDGFNVGDLNPLNIAQAGLIGLGEGLDKGRRRTVEALGEQAYNKMTGQETDRGFLGTIAAPSLWAYEQLNKINLSKQTENQIGDGGGFSDWLADPKNEAQVKRLYENGYNGYEGGDALWEYFISDKSNAQKMALDVMNDPLLWITAGTATAAQRSVQLGAKATQGLSKLGVAPAVAETIGSGVETAARKLPYVADPTEVLFPAIGKVAQKTGLASQIGKVTSNPAVQRLNPFRETETSRLRSEVSNAEDLMQNLGRQLDDPSVRPPQTPAQPMRLVDDPDVEGDLALFDPNTDSIIKLDAAGLQALDENLRNLSFDDYRTLLNDASGNSQGAKLSSMLFGMSMPPGMVQWFETTNWQQKPQAFERYVNMIIARLDRTASPIEQQNFIDSLYNDALNIARGRRAIGGVPANVQNKKFQAAARMDTIDVILAKGGFVDQNATQHARLARQLRGEGAAHGYVRPQAPRARQVPPPGGTNPPPPGLFGNTPPPPPPPPGGGGSGLYPPPTTPPPPPPGLSGGMPPRPNAPQPGGGLYPGSRPTPPPQTPNVPDAEIPPPPNMPGTTPEPPSVLEEFLRQTDSPSSVDGIPDRVERWSGEAFGAPNPQENYDAFIEWWGRFTGRNNPDRIRNSEIQSSYERPVLWDEGWSIEEIAPESTVGDQTWRLIDPTGNQFQLVLANLGRNTYQWQAFDLQTGARRILGPEVHGGEYSFTSAQGMLKASLNSRGELQGSGIRLSPSNPRSALNAATPEPPLPTRGTLTEDPTGMNRHGLTIEDVSQAANVDLTEFMKRYLDIGYDVNYSVYNEPLDLTGRAEMASGQRGLIRGQITISDQRISRNAEGLTGRKQVILIFEQQPDGTIAVRRADHDGFGNYREYPGRSASLGPANDIGRSQLESVADSSLVVYFEAPRPSQVWMDIQNRRPSAAEPPIENAARPTDTPQQSRTPYTGVLREPTDETVTVPLGFGGELEFEPWQAGSARPIFIETPFGPITRVVLTNFQGQRVVVPMGVAQRFDDGGVEAQSWVPISAIRPDGIDYALIDEDMASLVDELAAKIDNVWFSEKYEPESLAAQWEVEPDRVATILDSMIFANAMAPGARRPNMRSVFREEFMGRAQTNADAPVENVARQADTPEPTAAAEPTAAPEPPAPSQSLADQGWEIEQITTEMDGGMPTWSVRPPGTDRQYFLVRATQQDGSVRWEAYNAQTGQSRIIGGNDLSPEQAQRRLAEAIGQPGQAVPTEPRPQAPQRPPYREGQPITEAGFTVELGTRVGFNNMFRGHQLVEPFVVTAPDGRKYWMVARAEQPPGGQRDGVIFQGDPNQRQWRIYRADPATGRITRDQVLPRGSRSVTRARAELLIYEDVFGPLPRRPTQLPPLPGRRRRGSGGGTTPPNNTNRGGGGGGGGGTPPPPPRNGGYGGFEWADDRPGLPDPMRTWKTDVIFTDEDMAVLERVVDGEQLGQFVLNAKSEIQLAKQLLASGETVDTSPVLASFMKRYGPDGMGVIKEIDDITKITPEVENIIAAGLGRKKLEVAVGLRNAKGEIPIRPFMGSMKLGRALDTYDRISNALKGSQLYNWANILPFTVKQVVGNSVTLGLANPRSLREFFSPANWRAIYRREREGLLGATESSIDKLRSSYGLPPSNRIRQSTRQGSLAGAKLLGKENARTPIGELLAPDKLRDFGQVADNAMREAVYGTTARPMLADLKQRIRVHAQKRANDFGVQVDEDQLARLFDELERANDGGFSPVQLRTALRESGFAGDRLDDWAERVARDFLGGKVDDPATGFNGLRQIDQMANAEMERVGFRFEERNIDAVMNRLTFYHYWNSRAGLLYGQELLRKPLLAVSYYRAMEGLKNEAEQNNYPEWLNGWIQMMGTPAGFTTYLNPISTFGTMLTFAEAQFRESGNTISDLTAIGRFVDRSPFQVNPLLASMLYWSGALGSDAAMPNIGGGFTTINRDAVELVNLFRTNVQGKPPLSANFNITPALSNRIANWTTTLMANSGLDTNIVERRNLNAGQITNKNWFVQQILQEDDPTLTDEEAALVAAQIQDDLDNPIVKEAMARAAEIPFQGIFSTQPFSEGGFGGLVGGFLNTQISPITAVTRPTLKNENQAIRQADREGKPVSPVALNTAYLQNDVATMANQDDFRFEQTVDGYNAIGTDQQRAAKTLWDNITSGAVTGPVTANGVTYTPEQILGMSEDRRKDLARVALDDQGLMTELQRYWDTTAQYRAAHPELTDYWAFKDTAELYPGGVEQFAQAAMQRNEGYARYVRDQERIFPELKVPGSDRNKMLTSDDAYRSAMGIPKSIYETAQAGQGTGPYGPSIPGVAAGLTPGQQQAQTKGGAENQPSDYEESVKKDIDNFSGMVAMMNEYDAKMGYAEGTSVNQYINRVLNGKAGGKLDSAIYSAIDDAYGYVFPSKATLKNYLIWLLDPNANPDGSSDIQRFLDWNSVQLAREALGKPDVAGGEGGDLTRNALIGNQVVVRAADGSGYSFVPADQVGTGQVVQERPRVTPISTMLLLDPQNPYQTLGPVPPGLPLYLISREGDWALVETPDGVQGWVQVSGIANAA